MVLKVGGTISQAERAEKKFGPQIFDPPNIFYNATCTIPRLDAPGGLVGQKVIQKAVQHPDMSRCCGWLMVWRGGNVLCPIDKITLCWAWLDTGGLSAGR